MLGGLAALNFCGIGSLGSAFTQSEAEKKMFDLAYAHASGFKESAKVLGAQASGFFSQLMNGIYQAGYVLVDSASPPGKVGSSVLAPVVRASVGNFVGMDEESMTKLLMGLDNLSDEGYAFVTSSNTPTAYPKDVQRSPIQMQQQAQTTSWWAPVYTSAQTANTNAQMLREKALAAQQANAWQAKLPWIVGIGGTLLVISIALLAGSSE